MTSEVRCSCRKHAITGLRCTRCDTPICPDCSRPAVVGFFCRACAADRKSPLYQVSLSSFAMTAVVTLIVAVLGGWLISSISFGGFFSLVIGFFYGTGIGEVVLRMTGRKRGLNLEILAGAAAAIGVVAGRAIMFGGLMAVMPGASGVSSFLSPWTIVFAAVSAYGAVNRVRFI